MEGPRWALPIMSSLLLELPGPCEMRGGLWYSTAASTRFGRHYHRELELNVLTTGAARYWFPHRELRVIAPSAMASKRAAGGDVPKKRRTRGGATSRPCFADRGVGLLRDDLCRLAERGQRARKEERCGQGQG